MAEGGVTQVPSSPETLIVSGPFLTLSPQAMFDAWTQPELLTRWWPQVAEVDLRPGGEYHFSWPSMDWHLRGSYTVVEPPHRLAFTWNWDHEDAPERTVVMHFAPLPEGGTRLTLRHGTYTAEDTEEREGHLSGWLHFLGRLYLLSPELSQHTD
jgi:uncharacterized protein YndB with AHSA1/START domain